MSLVLFGRWFRRERVVAFIPATKRRGALLVRDRDGTRELSELGESEMVHTRVKLAGDALVSGFAYTDAMHAARWLTSSPPRRALCLGGGGGVLARQLTHLDRNLHVDVVEHERAVIDLASEHFGLPTDDPRIAIHEADALDFVKGAPREAVDIVLVDLFHALEASSLLADSGFFDEVRRVTAPSGAIAVNAIGTLDGGTGALSLTLHAVAEAFGRRRMVVLPILEDFERRRGAAELHALRNVVLFATPTALPDAITPVVSPILPRLHDALTDISVHLDALRTSRHAATDGALIPIRRTA